MSAENGRGKIGKSWPATNGNEATGNTAPTAQASVNNDRLGPLALILSVLALILAVVVLVSIWRVSSDVNNVRSLIENAAASASQSAVDAALAAERADKAERSAAINREYAVQVFPQLNRMGYPVRTPGEVDHYTAQPEDYADLQRFTEQQLEGEQ